MATTSFFSTTGIAGNATTGNINHDYYLGAFASNPTNGLNGETLATGMLYTRTGDNKLFYYDGTTWVEASPATTGAITAVVDDLTPQLGGDLQSNGSDIVLQDDDYLTIGTDADSFLSHRAAQNQTWIQSEGLELRNKAGSNLTANFSPGAAYSVKLYYQGAEKLAVRSGGILVTGGMTSDSANIAGLSYPSADGTDGQVITTDGAGNLTLQDAGGASVGSAIAFAIAL
jgi:hypothetical protein